MLRSLAVALIAAGLPVGAVATTVQPATAAPRSTAGPAVGIPLPALVPVPASGGFEALVDFGTLALQPLPGGRCQLTVSGVLRFEGTLTGDAPGTTTAMILAPCDAVEAAPPGTYADVFTFEGRFTGTVDGEPVEGDLRYAGVTFPGGDINAAITLEGDDGVRAVLGADAEVAVGGTYRGVVTR